MAHTPLTTGALARICQGEEVTEPVLQVLGNKAIAGGGTERFRLLLNDGQYSNSFSMLATQLNHLVHDNQIPQFSVIKLKQHVCNQMAGQAKRVVIVMDLEVLHRGETVGVKIGNPVTIGSDGKVPPPATNQNTNPNVGAASATKRPSDSALGGGPPKAMPAQVNPPRTSVLTPRPSAGSGPLTTPIASITPYQNKWTIRARVTDKGDMRTWNKGPQNQGKLFSMDLKDESGEIRVTAFKDQADKFYDYAQMGKVYYISNCSVKAANKQYSKLNNDYELTFKDNGSMELVEDADTSSIPVMTYAFFEIADLARCEKDSLVDVIGVCKTAGEPQHIVSRAGKELVKREITLVDRSATEVLLTLWGGTAENFKGEGAVVATKGAKVSDYNGVTLSGGSLMVEPDMPEAHEMRGWWDSVGRSAATSSITVSGGGGGRGGESKTIGEVKMERLGEGSDRGEYYSTTATLTFFSKDKALYKACGKTDADGKQCNKKVTGDAAPYRCEKCQEEKDTFAWRIMLQMNMADPTDNQWCSCFQETAEKVLGVKAEELGRLSLEDEDAYNKVFTDATFKSYNFRMRVKADTWNDETRLKHTVVDALEMDWAQLAKKLITEVEAMGGQVPEMVQRSTYGA